MALELTATVEVPPKFGDSTCLAEHILILGRVSGTLVAIERRLVLELVSAA